MKPIISLEDFVSTTGVDNAGEDLVEHVAEVESAHLELCEHDRHLAQISHALLEGCQHYCALRDVEAELQQADIFQEPTAKATMIAVEQMLADLGRPKTGTLATESLSETVKLVWDKLVEAFKRGWAFFKKWLDQLFDVCQRLKKRAVKLRRELDHYGDQVDPKPLTNHRLCQFISDVTGTAKASEVVSAIEATQADVFKVYEAMMRHMGQIHKAIRDMITLYHRNAKAAPADSEQAWKKFMDSALLHLYFDPAMFKSFGAKEDKTPNVQIEHTKVYTKAYPVGNGQFFARLSASANDTREHFGSIAHHCGFGIGPAPSKHHPDAVEPLPRRLIEQTFDKAGHVLDSIMRIRDEGKKSIAHFERLIKDIQLGITLEGANPAFEAQMVKVLAQSTTGLLNMTLSGERTMRMFQVKLVKQSFDYAALSMRQLPKIKDGSSRL